MRRAQDSPFDRLRQQARSVVDQWAQSVADGPLPVSLQDLAAAYKVRAVVFEPLLSDTALEREGNGFLICVNTEGRGANHKAGTEIELSSSDVSTWSAPLRFSVAHELAHLIILELTGREEKRDFFRRHSEALERTCNEMAGAMLLPQLRLKREIGSRLFDAVHLRDLCGRFAVSPETFFLRFRSADVRTELKAFDGLVVLARENQESIEIALSIVLEPLARQKWRHIAEARESLQIEAIGLPSEVLRSVCEEEALEKQVEIEWRHASTLEPRTILPCELKTCRLYSKRRAIIIAIRVIAPPEPAST